MNNRMNPDHAGYIDFMNRFITLSNGSERLEKLGELIALPKDTKLNTINEVPLNCYIVKTGRVICYEFSYTGDMRIYNFMEPGSLFLEEFLLFDKPCPVIFQTSTESQLVKIKKCDLKHAFKQDIDVVMDVCESMSSKYLSAMEYQRIGYRSDATWQLCRFLLLLVEHYSIHDGTHIQITEKMSQQTIADLLGMNRVTVTRKMKQLKDLNLIDIESGYIYITSIDRLKRYMDTIQYS